MRRSASILCLTFASLLWGSTWIFTPTLTQQLPPLHSSALAFFLGGIASALVAGVFFLFKSKVPGLPAREWLPHSVVLGASMLAFPAILAGFAGTHGTNGWTPLLSSFLPLSCAFLSQRWTPAMVLAIGASFTLIDSTVAFRTDVLLWIPLILAAIALQTWSLGTASRLYRRASVSIVLGSLAIQCLLASAITWLAARWFEGPQIIASWSSFCTIDELIALCFVSLGANTAAYTLFYVALRSPAIEPYQAAVSQWLQLLVLVVESLIFVRYTPPWSIWLAAVALLGCSVYTLRRPSDESQSQVPLRITPFHE